MINRDPAVTAAVATVARMHRLRGEGHPDTIAARRALIAARYLRAQAAADRAFGELIDYDRAHPEAARAAS